MHRLLKPQTAAQLLDCSIRTIYRIRHRLGAVPWGNRGFRIPSDSIQHVIEYGLHDLEGNNNIHRKKQLIRSGVCLEKGSWE